MISKFIEKQKWHFYLKAYFPCFNMNEFETVDKLVLKRGLFF